MFLSKFNANSIHDIHTVKKHYVIEIYAAIIEGKKAPANLSMLKTGGKIHRNQNKSHC